MTKTFELAIKKHQKNNLKDAEKLYLEVLKINPNHTGSLNNLGLIFKFLKQYDKAINFFEKSISLNPNQAYAYNNLGNTLKELFRFEDAEISYGKAITLKPDYAEAYNNLGNTLKELGRPEDAVASYRKAITLKPDYTEAHNNLGILFKNLNEYKNAIICFKEVIRIKPNSADSYHKLGEVFRDSHDYKKSISYFEKALTLKPTLLQARYDLGYAFYLLGKYKKCASQFKLINFKKSKSYLLSCLYIIDDRANFIEQLDKCIEQNMIDSLIGSLSLRSEIKYGISRANIFCKKPLDYILTTDLSEKYDFDNIFVKPVKNILDDNKIKKRPQSLLTNGIQTTGNLFLRNNDHLKKIEDIIHIEIKKYQAHFEESKEGIIKHWPKDYFIFGWIISMKNGSKIKPHIHSNGWLSGSIYINVPQKLKDNSGNLVVCIDDKESDKNNEKNPKKIINVTTGSLCLFPASLHHYTIPFKADEDRIVLAFDIIRKT